MDDVLVACPFCGEDSFDLIGLKQHFYGASFADPCEKFAATRSSHSIAELIAAGSAEDGNSANRKPSDAPARAEEAT